MNTKSKWPLMGETITFTDRLKMAKFVLTADRFTNGEKVKQFEAKWNEWLGSKYSLYVSSGSTANFLLIAALIEKYGLKRNDKVLLPGCTWMTNVAPIIQLGLKPVFCDINLNDYSFDLYEARNIAYDHPDIKMIFITHLLGFSAQNEKLQEIFPNAIIVEDVCESHGCLGPDGKKRGSNSLGATFSFYFGHHMSTIEGGMVSTNNEELYDLMKMKRSHGLARESVFFEKYAQENSHIDKAFLFMTDGYNFRNHELCAVLGLSQLKRLDSMIEQRQHNYELYYDIVSSSPEVFYHHDFQEGNSSFCFPFVCKSEKIANRLKRSFQENLIEYRPIVSGNLLNQPFLKNYKLTKFKKETNLDLIQKQGLYIGNNHFVGMRKMEWLDEIIDELYWRVK